MGGRSSTPEEYRSYYSTNSHITKATNASQVFRSSGMAPEFDPSQMKLPREACDSAESPLSRGIIYAEDVTGSMGRYLLSLIKDEFPRLINLTYDSVSYNPHIMFMGVGDAAASDRAPLQVTQFEADLRMLDQLQKIYLERGGGDNDYESYILPWYFAAKHIRMDCWEKRGEKGFLFTFGDEEPTPHLTKQQITKVFGNNSSIRERMLTGQECLEMASEKFNCYHIILHGSGYSTQFVVKKWKQLMGGHACDLSDHTKLPELVTTILRMHEGLTKTQALAKIQDEHARMIVASALCDHEEVVENTAVAGTHAPIEVF